MTINTLALEAYALTKSRRAADGEMHIWRCPDIVVEAEQCVAVQAEEPTDLALLLGMLSTVTDLTGGVLRIGGEETEDWKRHQRAQLRARRVGLLFRVPQLLPDLNIIDNVALAQRAAGIPQRQARTNARNTLAQLGLQEWGAKTITELTPLQAQQIALARALANHPTILIADDPTTDFSSQEADLFLTWVRKICREQRIAILLGTLRTEVARSADKTIFLPRAAFEFVSTAEDVSRNELYTDLYEVELSPFLRPIAPLINVVLKPLTYTAIVALMVVFLTFFGLHMAGLSDTEGVGAASAFSSSLSQTSTFISGLLRGDLGTYSGEANVYYWRHLNEKSIRDSLRSTFGKSVVLLLLSMALGALIGVPLGIVAALARHRKYSLAFIAAAIVGVSTPSFFLALLLQILEINAYRWTGITLLPVGGFGWDSHIVLPALVLAARPIAQVARVSFVALSEVLDADYIRTARAKGLNTRLILSRHALRNAGVPILATLGTSLRFSLSSLPIVEVLFHWPGMGDLLLTAITQGETRLAATLTLALGVLFVVVYVILDSLYRWVDPRLRGEKAILGEERTWTAVFRKGWSGLREIPERLEALLSWKKKNEALPALPTFKHDKTPEVQEDQRRRDAKIKQERRRTWVSSTVGSLSFMLGAIILLGLLGIVIWGQELAPHNPYNPMTSLKVGEQTLYAPFEPSSTFPLGSDTQGRDILTLLLYGARRTLSIAFFAVLARVLIGSILGALAGWFSNSLLDRALTGMTQIMAAFPTLLLAMVLIYAFGIRQGVWVFALALSLVGWGEAAQFVRGQVMRIREQDYIEGALSVGLGDAQLLMRHVLPNLVPSLVVLACLEMGGVLMLLGELGFIGVFIGGGLTSSVGMGNAQVTYFSVPEWGAMLSGTWRNFRSKPWMTFYPALAFTMAIMGFNLFGEGLRRLTERLTLSMHRIINRYTMGAALGLGALLLLVSESTSGWAQFSTPARQFDATHAISYIQTLAAPEMKGRGLDTPELDSAAHYIAQQFAALGLQPAGAEVNGQLTYFAQTRFDYRKLLSAPVLELHNSAGQWVPAPLIYQRDYAEMPGLANSVDIQDTEVVCLGMRQDAQAWPTNMSANPSEIWGKTLLITTPDMPSAFYFMSVRPSAILIVADNEQVLAHRELISKLSGSGVIVSIPYMLISPQVADAILQQAGTSLDQVITRREQLGETEGFWLPTGVHANLHVKLSGIQGASPAYVQAFTPGLDDNLDNEVILLLAHYDGQGEGFNGTTYPGANMNASGVAVMLETARLLKETDYRPNRTIMYVAWAGGEQGAATDFVDILQARTGFIENYRLAAVIELTGIGAGASNTLMIDHSTSGRLTEVIQEAAKRNKVPTSTSGVGARGKYDSLYPLPDKKIPYLTLTWSGGDPLVHTPADTIDNIKLDKLGNAGRVVALTTMYLAHERQY